MDHKREAYAPHLAIRAGVSVELMHELTRAWEDDKDFLSVLRGALATESILLNQLPITLVSLVGISLGDAQLATMWATGAVSETQFRTFLFEKADMTD